MPHWLLAGVMIMTDADKGRILLPIARAAISCALGIYRTADESAPWLTEPGACFVTLTHSVPLAAEPLNRTEGLPPHRP